MEKVEVKISGVAKVPAKYAPFIEALMATMPEMFQEMADAWISDLRLTAAKTGCEVDDVIAAALEEAKGEKVAV